MSEQKFYGKLPTSVIEMRRNESKFLPLNGFDMVVLTFTEEGFLFVSLCMNLPTESHQKFASQKSFDVAKLKENMRYQACLHSYGCVYAIIFHSITLSNAGPEIINFSFSVPDMQQN